MNVHFESLGALHWLWLVAAVALVAALSLVLRTRRLRTFADPSLMARLAPAANSSRPWWRRGLVVAAMIALVAALIDPRWGLRYEEVRQRGIDVFIVLDVSRSMLAEDVRPNRLERAKQHARDLVEAMHGDRVGLITFAGSSALRCPLTSDYGAFRLSLIDVTTESAARGGTRLGDALRLAGSSFTDDVPDHKVVFVFSDGEDHGSTPIDEAKRLRDEFGIRVYAIGLGDATEGARIPVTIDGTVTYLTHEGQQVWSKMDTSTLRDMALAGDGAFIAAGTRQLDAGAFYREKVEPVAAREIDAARLERYNVQYQWFAGLALALLTIEASLAIGRRVRAATPTTRASAARRAGGAARQVAALLTVLLIADAGSRANAQEVDRAPAESDASAKTARKEARALAAKAREALDAGRHDEAVESYEALHAMLPESPEVLYNLALAQYGRGDHDAAADRFLEAMAIAGDAPLASDAAHNLIGTTWAQTEPLLDAQDSAVAPSPDPAMAQALFDKAPKRLERAIDHYRRRIASEPGDATLRRDAEVAQRIIKSLEALAEQQQQQQGGEQDKKDQEQEKQEQEQDQQQQQGQQQQQDQQQQQAQPEQQAQQNQQQGQNQQDQQQPSDEQQQQQQQEQPSPQEQQQQQDQESQQGDGQREQSSADTQDESESDRASGASGEPREQRMTREEAERLLQQVRDKEQQRREMLARKAKQAQMPVDKDW